MVFIVKALFWLFFALSSLWITLAIKYSPVFPAFVQPTTTYAFACLAIFIPFAVLFLKPSRIRNIFFLLWAVFALGFFFLYLQLKPQHDHSWAKEVAVLPWVEREDDLFRFHNVRDFVYRSETDFDAQYITKEVRLSDLKGVDLITSHWGSPHIAHIMVSFAFQDGQHLAFSLETRKEENEAYSALAGFFRAYELIAVAAEERDIIYLRTDVRKPAEDVYVWPIDIAPKKAEIFFLRYVELLNSLKEKPQFYSTATTNCTTGVLDLALDLDSHLKYSWKILLSGHAASFLYDIDSLDRSVSFEALQKRSRVNERAHLAGRTRERFSELLRVHE